MAFLTSCNLYFPEKVLVCKTKTDSHNARYRPDASQATSRATRLPFFSLPLVTFVSHCATVEGEAEIPYTHSVVDGTY